MRVGSDDQPTQPLQPEGFNWVEFNKRKKTEAMNWVQSQPLQRLACMREVAGILLRIMYGFLHLSSHAFEKKQRLLSANSKTRTYPVLEAWRGKHVGQAMTSLMNLLLTRPKLCIEQMGMTMTPRLQALRFRMISCAMTSLHMLVRVRRSGFPFKLFQVLDGKYEDILATPVCMRDELTESILTRYVPCLQASYHKQIL